jgi:sugar phosphate isomerase/epimerase
MTYQLYASGSLAGMAIVAGFAEELREFLKRLVASLSERDPSSCEQLALLAWANLEVGNLAAAHETLAAAERRAEALGVRLAYTTIWRIAARLALSEGRWDEGLRALEQAVTLAQAMPYPYAEAQARYVAGLLHRARGEPGDAGAARQAFTDALALLTRLGERFYAERVERDLAQLPA